MDRVENLQIFMPTKVIFGVGTVSQVGAEAAALGKKALVVTAADSMRQHGHTARVERSLTHNGMKYELFDAVESNPSLKTVETGAAFAYQTGCDVIIGLGGGSAVDAAKVIASTAGLKLSFRELFDHGMSRKGLPSIAVPTTAGTGAEVNHTSLITVRENHQNMIRSFFNFPSTAIIDPELMLSLPPTLTANAGIDALTNAIEAYTSRSAQPVSDLYARKAISLIQNYLRQAVEHGEDLNARKGMAMASNLAGIARTQAGSGAARGIGMAISGVCNVHHSTAVGLALPGVIQLNLSTNLEKYRDIAQLLGAKANGMNLRDAAELAAHAVKKLIWELQLPSNLRELGIPQHLLAQITADPTFQQVSLNNPRPVTEKEKTDLLYAMYE